MKFSKFHPIGPLLLTLAVSACGESKQQLAKAQGLSCTELSREIGKREQRRDTARVDGWINIAESAIAGDSDVGRAADIEGAVNSIDEADAEKSLHQLQGIYQSKGCI